MDKEKTASPVKIMPEGQPTEPENVPAAKKVAALTARFGTVTEKKVPEVPAKTDVRKRMLKSTESLPQPAVSASEIDFGRQQSESINNSSALPVNLADLERVLSRAAPAHPSRNAAVSEETPSAAVSTKVAGETSTNVDSSEQSVLEVERTFNNELSKRKLVARPSNRRMPTRVTVAEPLGVDSSPQKVAHVSPSRNTAVSPKKEPAPSNVAKPGPSMPNSIGIKLPPGAVALPRPVPVKPPPTQPRPKAVEPVAAAATGTAAVASASESTKAVAPHASSTEAATSNASGNRRSINDTFARVRVGVPKTDVATVFASGCNSSTAPVSVPSTGNVASVRHVPLAGISSVPAQSLHKAHASAAEKPEKENDAANKRPVKATVDLDTDKKTTALNDVISSLADRLMTPVTSTTSSTAANTKRAPPPISRKPPVLAQKGAANGAEPSGKPSGYNDESSKSDVLKSEAKPRPTPATKPFVAPKTTPGNVHVSAPLTTAKQDEEAGRRRSSVAEMVRNLQQQHATHL